MRGCGADVEGLVVGGGSLELGLGGLGEGRHGAFGGVGVEGTSARRWGICAAGVRGGGTATVGGEVGRVGVAGASVWEWLCGRIMSEAIIAVRAHVGVLIIAKRGRAGLGRLTVCA